LKRFTDDAEAAEACGSNQGLPVKIRRVSVIRASISSVVLPGIHGFQKLSRHQLAWNIFSPAVIQFLPAFRMY
jgi:hypothetical protein